MRQVDGRSDAELVGLCNSGSRRAAIDAFQVLYTRHRDYVLRVAFRYVRDTDLALDVLQETFTYLLRKFPPPGNGLVLNAQLQTLLYVAAKNNAISLLRKESRTEANGRFDPEQMPAPAYRDDSDLGRLLTGLAPEQREVVTLRFVDDLALQDIAEILDIPLGTVKSRLHTAVQAMRNSPYVKDFFDK